MGERSRTSTKDGNLAKVSGRAELGFHVEPIGSPRMLPVQADLAARQALRREVLRRIRQRQGIGVIAVAGVTAEVVGPDAEVVASVRLQTRDRVRDLIGRRAGEDRSERLSVVGLLNLEALLVVGTILPV